MAGKSKNAEKRQRAAFERMSGKKFATFEEWRASIELSRKNRARMKEEDAVRLASPHGYTEEERLADAHTDYLW